MRTEKRGNKVAITVTGEAELKGGDITVPGDPSSAAFLAAAALIVPGSEVFVDGVLIAAAFCMYNRYVDGLGAPTPPDRADYADVGRLIVGLGYVAAIPPVPEAQSDESRSDPPTR